MMQCDHAATLYWMWTGMLLLWAFGFSENWWSDMFDEWRIRVRGEKTMRTVEARKAEGGADYVAVPKDD
jgi:hypothetical protein